MNDRQIIEAAVTILPLLHDLLGPRALSVIRRLAWWLAPERAGSVETAHEVLAILAENDETRRWLHEYLPKSADTIKSLFRTSIPQPIHSAPFEQAIAIPRRYDVKQIYFATDRASGKG